MKIPVRYVNCISQWFLLLITLDCSWANCQDKIFCNYSGSTLSGSKFRVRKDGYTCPPYGRRWLAL